MVVLPHCCYTVSGRSCEARGEEGYHYTGVGQTALAGRPLTGRHLSRTVKRSPCRLVSSVCQLYRDGGNTVTGLWSVVEVETIGSVNGDSEVKANIRYLLFSRDADDPVLQTTLYYRRPYVRGSGSAPLVH